MISRCPSSWISIFFKTSENLLLRNNKTVQKRPKKVKIDVLFSLKENTKITNLERHVCQNTVAMVMERSGQNNLSYKIIVKQI